MYETSGRTIHELKKPVFAVYYTILIPAVLDGNPSIRLVHWHSFYEFVKALQFVMKHHAEMACVFPFEDGEEPIEILWEDVRWKNH